MGVFSRQGPGLRFDRLDDRTVPTVVPVGPEIQVSVATVGVSAPAVGLDGDGDFVVAWQQDGVDGSGSAVMARRYTKTGAALGTPFRVNQFTVGNQQNAAVARNDAGDFVVVWESASAQDGSRAGVYARRYDAGGAALGDEFLVNQFTLGAQAFPAVAMDPVGDFVIAWEGAYQDGDGYGVYARRYNAAGNPLGPEELVNSTTVGDQRFPSVARDAVGNYVVAWQAGDGDEEGVVARRFGPDGTPLTGELSVNTTTADSQRRPRVATDPAGRFTVAWESRIQDGGTTGVYARLFQADAQPISGEFRVNAFTTGEQSRPSVGVDAAGEIVIAWQSDGQDNSGAGVYAQRFTAGGVPFGPEFRVHSTTTGDQTAPAMSMDALGDFVVAWPSVDSPLPGIIAQRHFKPPVPRAVVQVDDGTPQRSRVESLIVTFNTLVNVSPGGITMVGPGGPVTLALDYSLSTTPQTIVKLTFSGNNVTPAGLADGRYALTIASAHVSNFNGEPYDGDGDGLPGPDGVFDFHRLYGDIDGDADVDAADFAAFRGAFGSFLGQPGFNRLFDSDGDNDVDAFDFAQFRLRYGLSVP